MSYPCICSRQFGIETYTVYIAYIVIFIFCCLLFSLADFKLKFQLSETFCVGKSLPNYRHPFFCDIFVRCDSETVTSMTRCEAGECFDGTTCIDCTLVQCAGKNHLLLTIKLKY